MKKIAVFDKCLASSRVVNGATVRCYKQGEPPDRGKLMTLIAGVCAQYSSEVHLTVLLWSFVAARCYAIDNDIVIMEY